MSWNILQVNKRIKYPINIYLDQFGLLDMLSIFNDGGKPTLGGQTPSLIHTQGLYTCQGLNLVCWYGDTQSQPVSHSPVDTYMSSGQR